jgi:hypothetical protein
VVTFGSSAIEVGPQPLRAVGVQVCQAFTLPDEVAHECIAHIVGQCDEDDDASGGVSGCGNADDRAVAVDVMAAREPECDTSRRL